MWTGEKGESTLKGLKGRPGLTGVGGHVPEGASLTGACCPSLDPKHFGTQAKMAASLYFSQDLPSPHSGLAPPSLPLQQWVRGVDLLVPVALIYGNE